MMSPQETPRLESCPFCANTRAAVRPFGDGLFAVHCRGLCECVGPLAASEADAIEAWNRRLSSSSGEPTDGEKWSFARKCVQRGYDICVQQPDDDAQGLASMDATAADLVKHYWPTPTSSLQEDSPESRPDPRSEDELRAALKRTAETCDVCSRPLADHGPAATCVSSAGIIDSSGPEPVGEHPEDTCELCGRGNVTWFAPSPLWNDAIRKPQGKDYRAFMLCPVCFIKAAESVGVGGDGAWRVAPSDYTGPDDDPRIRPEPAGETVETATLLNDASDAADQLNRRHMGGTAKLILSLVRAIQSARAERDKASSAANRWMNAALTMTPPSGGAIAFDPSSPDAYAAACVTATLRIIDERDAARSALLDARREIAAFRFQPAGEQWPDMIERDFVLDVLDRVGGQE